jgi:hypothetical protein
VRLAARGLRDMDDGEKPVEDQAERAQLKKQALAVYAKSVAVAVVLTGVALVPF